MSIKKCPKCGTKLLADGSTTPDGEFIGMATAGYCPNCNRFYRWSTGELVPEEYSRPSKVSVAIDGSKPIVVYKRRSLLGRTIVGIWILSMAVLAVLHIFGVWGHS